MKAYPLTGRYVAVLVAVGGLTWSVCAQPAAAPLGIQGLDQWVTSGARSRAMGSTGLAGLQDASALFSNPAALSQLSVMEVRLGGSFASVDQRQDQSWVPLKNLPGLSLLFEGQVRGIRSPLNALGQPLTPWTTLQKPYDDIASGWRRRTSVGRPQMLAIAVPVTVADVRVTAGLGISQMVDLDHRYLNNNALDPYLGQQRPYTGWSKAIDTLHVHWFQYLRSREGDIFGATAAMSVQVTPDLMVGALLKVLSGSSNDLEQRIERGHLNIAVGQGEAKDFMVDTVRYYQTATGTSQYSGVAFTGGLIFRQPRYSIGVTLRPRVEIARSWDRTITIVDTTVKPFPVRIDSAVASVRQESGTDHVSFPQTLAFGIVLRPTDRWTVAFDYEVRNLGAVERRSDGVSGIVRPWVGSNAEWRLGVEYRPADLLALRTGYHEASQAFVPDGAALMDEPARATVLAFGVGFNLGAVLLDVAYEYRALKYQDLYQSNINANALLRHQILAEFAYRF